MPGRGDVVVWVSTGVAKLRQRQKLTLQYQYRGTSLIRKRLPLGPYCSPMPRDLWLS